MRYIAHPVDKKICQLSTTPNDWGDGWIIVDRVAGSLIKADPTNDEIAYLQWVTPIYGYIEEAEYAIECLDSTNLAGYSERVFQAAKSYIKLKDKYLDPNDTTQNFRNLIAEEWEVNPLDLDSKVWEINKGV
jgi:hypothetical protein